MTGINQLMGVGEGHFDGHAHVFRADLPVVAGRRYTPVADALFSTYCDLLRANGLNGGLLLQTSFLGTDNAYMLEMLEQGRELPDLTFRGVVVVEPDISLSELRRLGKTGIVGVRLNLFGKQHPLDLDQWTQVLRHVDDLGWHVDLHCEGEHVEKIGTAILKHCQTLVVDHFGLLHQKSPPNVAGFKWLLGTVADRIFVKASAPYRVFPENTSAEAAALCAPMFKQLYDHFGPERLVWGSDWPWTQFEDRHTYEDTVAWRDDWLAKL